jgi:transcriptional regulator with XRE-family HTH domain
MVEENPMYEIFERLLTEKGLKPADITRATGIKSSVFSDWKKGRSKPNTEKMIKIANFLGVTVEYLLTGILTETIERNSYYAILDLLKDIYGKVTPIEYEFSPLGSFQIIVKYYEIGIGKESFILFDKDIDSLTPDIKNYLPLLVNKLKGIDKKSRRSL